MFNAEIAEAFARMTPIWELGAERARRGREEGRSIFGPIHLSARAETMSIARPEGEIALRIIRPEHSRGVFFHIHGGGFVVGGNHHHDAMLERLADATSLTVVSTDYRLAPEHPYPAGPDDCEAAAVWLAQNAKGMFGSGTMAIGGESAGANLAAVTMIRLRDRHDLLPFSAALLTYGAFDLRGTPSSRSFGDRPLILNTPTIRWFNEQFVGGHDPADPDISPLFADLHEMPPALFTVGDLDPLLDDSLFMEARWRAAGNVARLDIWPGGIHAFDYFDTPYGRAARNRMHAFLNETLDSSPIHERRS